jgi:endonuclease YncB( thermonuclease family)
MFKRGDPKPSGQAWRRMTLKELTKPRQTMASFAKRIAGQPCQLAARQMKAVALIFALALFLPRLAHAETVEGVARIVDGDTIEIKDQKIRLWGIDAPEPAQRCTEGGTPYPCGLDASRALSKLIGRKPVSCMRRDTDRYRRMVAVCSVAGVDISRWMVTRGQAIAFRKYSLDYVAEEDHARAAKVGIWAGEFQDPSDFRRQSRGGAPVLGILREQGLARGACNCPADIDRAGRRCGARSAYIRPGGLKPMCAVP